MDALPNDNDFATCAEMIREDNPLYNFAELERMNRFVRTTDSQENHCECPPKYWEDNQLKQGSHPQPIAPISIPFFRENFNCRGNQLRDVLMLSETQRPYLELTVTIEDGEKLFNAFLKDRHFGVSRFDGEKYESNDTMRELVKHDNEKFQTKDAVVLTCYELDKPITNRDGITTKWLTPTKFYFDEHWMEYDEKYYKFFLIGRDSDTDVNHLFYKINSVFQ